MLALVTVLTSRVWADPVPAGTELGSVTTRPPQRTPSQSTLRPSWDLDGTYIWLGPVGAATGSAEPMRASGSRWDSTFGAEIAVVRVREREPLGAIGGSFGACRSAGHGSRVWVDSVLGTAIGGHMVGMSLGPVIALADDHHPLFGASLRVWAYAGISPYARIGFAGSAAFWELGLQLPLPVFRR